MMKAYIEFIFDSSEELELVERSIKPEAEDNIPGSKVHLHRKEDRLMIIIESRDISSLRAACNSYLRWIDTAIRVKKEMEKI